MCSGLCMGDPKLMYLPIRHGDGVVVSPPAITFLESHSLLKLPCMGAPRSDRQAARPCCFAGSLIGAGMLDSLRMSCPAAPKQ